MSSNDPIKSIVFERQEAALCAQHALNMLLQDHLFTWENLRDIARQMDQMEHEILGNNANTAGRSENMNDSGFFSIQVIEKALEAFELKLTNIENPVMSEYKVNPLIARAYICNLREHWFVLRKFGNQWFELNSINRGPRLLSDTYVQEFLHQLAAEGYSIFVVQGILPASEADSLITLCPVVIPPKQPKPDKPEGMVQKFFNTVGRRLGGGPYQAPDSQEDRELAIAMAMSMETSSADSEEKKRNSEEMELEKAIKMSLGVPFEEDSGAGTSSGCTTSSGGASGAPTSSAPSPKGATSSGEPSKGPTSSGASETLTSSKSPSDVVTMTSESGLTETPILGTSSSASEFNGITREQQRRDREKFLQRLEKKNEEAKK